MDSFHIQHIHSEIIFFASLKVKGVIIFCWFCLGLSPCPGCNRHHQDWKIFATGRGDNPSSDTICSYELKHSSSWAVCTTLGFPIETELLHPKHHLRTNLGRKKHGKTERLTKQKISPSVRLWKMSPAKVLQNSSNWITGCVCQGIIRFHIGELRQGHGGKDFANDLPLPMPSRTLSARMDLSPRKSSSR